MLVRIRALIRLAFRITLGLVLVAWLLGRYAPTPRDNPGIAARSRARPRYLAIRSQWFPGPPYVPRLLDVETGKLASCPLPGAEAIMSLGCSPWRDRTGQYHMVARCGGRLAGQPARAPKAHELVRYTFPGGEVLGRAAVEPLPAGRICWAPDRSDRILFAAGDGRLYRYDFPRGDHDGGDAGAARPRPLRWKGARRGGDVAHLQDPCWPDDPALDGRILVALNLRCREEASGSLRGSQLWWVRPDRDATNIVSAGRAILHDGGDSPDSCTEERMPSVGKAADGTLLLAYLSHLSHDATWELWVAPIAPGTTAGPPRVLASSGRRLAEGCALVAPAFSPDGRWIFATVTDKRCGVRVRRLAATESIAPPSWSARSRGWRSPHHAKRPRKPRGPSGAGTSDRAAGGAGATRRSRWWSTSSRIRPRGS
jgi:hypothetical protein